MLFPTEAENVCITLSECVSVRSVGMSVRMHCCASHRISLENRVRLNDFSSKRLINGVPLSLKNSLKR